MATSGVEGEHVGGVEMPVKEVTIKPYKNFKNSVDGNGHHIIQDATVRDIPGYSKRDALAVGLEGPPSKIGTEHYNATQSQIQSKGDGTYGRERGIAYVALKAAGLTKEVAKKVVRAADEYFKKLGVNSKTPTRTPQNRIRK